ncbi:hypothetical protein AciX9_0802 [Granulicella tundricola MP5ACTX9]|uniref:HPr kinase n=2 Tax=Granulicella TaxID=940557 RepID=E8X104_GRATM|nr:hypothetical protein AciX9_0802 [Granulicella tundricola MP5ACTX9]
MPGDEAGGHADLWIVREDAEGVGVHAEVGRYLVSDDGIVIDVPGIVLFSYRHGTASLGVQVHPGAEPELVETMLVSTALPAVLWMRGRVVLHAAVAVLPGMREAIAFAGPSGCGKSSLLQQLVRQGARIVAEDACVLSPGELMACGLPGLILMRAASSDELDRRIEVPVALEQQLGSARLGALVVLTDRGEPVRRLRGAAALEALLKNLHRPSVPRLLGQMPGLLPQFALLLRQLPVYSVHRSIGVEELKGLSRIVD